MKTPLSPILPDTRELTVVENPVQQALRAALRRLEEFGDAQPLEMRKPVGGYYA